MKFALKESKQERQTIHGITEVGYTCAFQDLLGDLPYNYHILRRCLVNVNSAGFTSRLVISVHHNGLVFSRLHRPGVSLS